MRYINVECVTIIRSVKVEFVKKEMSIVVEDEKNQQFWFADFYSPS